MSVWAEKHLGAYWDSKSRRLDAAEELLAATEDVPACAYAVASAMFVCDNSDQRTVIFRALLELMGQDMSDFL